MAEEADKPASNVVQFTPKREYVWTCTMQDCGSQTFWLHRDGSVQCGECREYMTSIVWGHRGKEK